MKKELQIVAGILYMSNLCGQQYPFQNHNLISEERPKDLISRLTLSEKAPVFVLKFDQSLIKLNKGNHELVKLTVLPSVTPVTLISSNKDMVSLSVVGVITYKLAAKKEGSYMIYVSTDDGNLSASCQFRILPSNIHSPWKLDDIIDEKASALYNNDIFTIEGGGADIWGGNYQFAFLNRESDIDCYISACIISQTNTNPRAKTGLLFRENTAPNSRFFIKSITPAYGLTMQWRDKAGESCNKKDFGTPDLPVYLKLTKIGTAFTVYKSIDGNEWEMLGDVELSPTFPEPFLVGMAVCSHTSQSLNLSKFDHIILGTAEKNNLL